MLKHECTEIAVFRDRKNPSEIVKLSQGFFKILCLAPEQNGSKSIDPFNRDTQMLKFRACFRNLGHEGTSEPNVHAKRPEVLAAWLRGAKRLRPR